VNSRNGALRRKEIWRPDRNQSSGTAVAVTSEKFRPAFEKIDGIMAKSSGFPWWNLRHLHVDIGHSAAPLGNAEGGQGLGRARRRALQQWAGEVEDLFGVSCSFQFNTLKLVLYWLLLPPPPNAPAISVLR
jgi:hypothetical protein